MAHKRIRPAQPSETQATADLIARVFARDPSYVRLTGWYRWMLRNPDHRPEFVRVVELNGQIVSHLLVVERRIRLRSGVVRVAGLSVVATLQEHQRRGLNRELMQETLDFARAEGFHLSLLDGIPDYYSRYGYCPVMPKYEARIQTRKALALAPGLEVRELSRDEARHRVQELASLYEAETSELVGSVVRRPEYWSWLLERDGAILACEANGELCAYCWLGEGSDEVRVEEAAGRDPTAVSAVLSAVAQRAARAVQAEIVLHVHPDSPFARAMMLLTGAQMRTAFSPNAGWMGLALDALSVVRASLPENASFAGARSVLLRTDAGSVRIRSKRDGAVAEEAVQQEQDDAIAELSAGALLQLAFGYASPKELAALGRLKADPETLKALGLLFPTARPGIFVKDHF